MKYLLLAYSAEQDWTPAELEKCYEVSTQLTQDLHIHGHYLNAAPLHSVTTATSVRVRDGKRLITDGPFAETREQLGGYFLIDAPDLDEAIAIATRIPTAQKGTVEIRPVVELGGLPNPDKSQTGLAMKSNPYLMFNGQCREAFEFYQQCLGGDIVAMMTYRESPTANQMSAAAHDLIMHACLRAGNLLLMGSDDPCNTFEKPQGFSVNIQMESLDEAKRVFEALSTRGTIHMPFEQTFWAKGYGLFNDQFGTPWMINCL